MSDIFGIRSSLCPIITALYAVLTAGAGHAFAPFATTAGFGGNNVIHRAGNDGVVAKPNFPTPPVLFLRFDGISRDGIHTVRQSLVVVPGDDMPSQTIAGLFRERKRLPIRLRCRTDRNRVNLDGRFVIFNNNPIVPIDGEKYLYSPFRYSR